ncbi:MAG TPA: serine hydrolase, partial [Vicinamibacteria bacterium]|nr:serine hydrolase [Vicinamibacteria bacterium]
MNALLWVTVLALGSADSRVDAIFQEYDRPGSPGCAIGVYRDGSLSYARGFGFSNLDHEVPIEPSTVFYVGSVSKQFTAMSVALAAREGKLSLDDPVRKYLPELPDFGKPITIRHFLHHTGGLREKWDLLEMSGWRDGDVVTLDDVLERVSRQKELNFPPGTEHLYNNTGYDLISIVVQRATGKTLSEYAREHIFEPLGMKDTRFVDDRRLVIPRRATGYSRAADGRFQVDMPNLTTTGSGSLYTTVLDLALWDESFYSGKLGGKDLVTLVETPGTLTDGTKLTYAFGLSVEIDHGLRRVEHGGALVGYRAQITRYPEKHFSVAVLCNVASARPGELASRIAEIYLGLPPEASEDTEDPEPPPYEPEELASYFGTYESPELDVRWTLAGDDTLVLKRWRFEDETLLPVARDEFRSALGTIRFQRGASGAVEGFTLSTG